MRQINRKSLKNRNVAVLMADGFEMAEYTIPINALRLAGANITVISLRHGRIRGVNVHEPARRVHADLRIEEAHPADYDALFIPGGLINPDLLRQSEAVRDFVKDFEKSGKPIASLCHGPWVLASSGLVKDRVLTSWPGTRDDMVNAGAIWLDQPVVRDGNLITSRGPQDFGEFVPAVVDFFSESPSTSRTRTDRKSRTSSPQRKEPPAAVIGTLRWLPRPSLRGLLLGMVVGGVAASTRRRMGPRVIRVTRQVA